MTGRPPRAPSTCDAPGCDTETEGRYCAAHVRGRGTDHRSHWRASHYQRAWRQGPRAVVLARDPLCQVCYQAPSTVADHWPTERRDLVRLGVPDPDDPALMRGACRSCANRHSAQARHGQT